MCYFFHFLITVMVRFYSAIVLQVWVMCELSQDFHGADSLDPDIEGKMRAGYPSKELTTLDGSRSRAEALVQAAREAQPNTPE
jgi:hypothetical protein